MVGVSEVGQVCRRRAGGRPSSAAGIGVAVLSLLLAAACSATVAGSPRPVEADRAAPPTATTGPVPDVVAPPLDTVGRRLEAHLLAGATALVQTAFPDRATECAPSGAFVTTAELEPFHFLPTGVAAILDAYGFVTGWGECGLDAAGLATETVSLELSDPASARAAVTELAAAAAPFAVAADTAPDGAVVLLSTDGFQDVVEVWAPVGRTLAVTWHQAPPGEGVDGAVRVSADQVRLLAAFTPTPQTEVPDLPLDPDRLAGFVVEPPGVRDQDNGPYGLESYLRVSIDPIRERELLTANGFISMYVKGSTDGPLAYAAVVYAFPSSTQSNAVYNGFAELEKSTFGGTPFVLPSIPAAPCFGYTDAPPAATSYQRCYVGYGTHLASVDVYNLTRPDDVAPMDALLSAQRDLIDG